MKTFSIWTNTACSAYPHARGEMRYEYVVVGGGIVGSLHALMLASRGKHVLLLEKHKIMSAISADQGGMITRTFDSPYGEELDTVGAGVLRARFDAAQYAQNRLFDLVRALGGDCDFRHGNSWYGAYDDERSLTSLAELWRGVCGADIEAKLKTAKITLGTPFGKFMEFAGEGSYNPVKFVINALNSDIGRRFIHVHEHTPVQSVEVQNDCVVLTTPEAKITAGKVVLATGGPALLADGLAHLFQSEWCSSVALHYPNGLELNPHCNYFDTPDITTFRAVDAHTLLLLGAGPDLTDPEDRAKEGEYMADLRKFADEKVGHGYTVTNQWTGALIDTEDRMPIGGEHPHYPGRVFLALGTGGTGNVNGSVLAIMNTARMVGDQPVFFDELFNVTRFGHL